MPHIESQELQSKYSDWCSARVAEHLLRLNPEEVFLLGERYRESEATPAPDEASGSSFFPAPYSRAERAIRAAHAELRLPPFEEWVEEYLSDPGRFDRDIIGFRADASSDSFRFRHTLPRTG